MDTTIRVLSKPKPSNPKPVCAGPNCGGNITSSYQSLDEITCPCGYGYYDAVEHKFVPGSLVRSGQAPSRTDYETHVRQCSKQQKGAPVLGVLYVGHQSGEALGSVYLGATGGRPQSQHPSEPHATGRYQSAISDVHHLGLNAHSNELSRGYKSDVEAKSLFLDHDRVELEPLRLYLQLLNERAGFQLQFQGDILKGKRGWIVIGPRSLPHKAEIDIVQDSLEWRKEAIRGESAGVTYTTSKTWEKRRKSGPVSLDDNELRERTENTTFPLPTLRQSAHPEGNRKKTRDDESLEVSDEGSAQTHDHPQKRTQAKDTLGKTTHRGGGYGSTNDHGLSDDENKTYPHDRSKGLFSTTDSSPGFADDYGGEDKIPRSGATRRDAHDDRRDSGLSMSPPVPQQHSDHSKTKRSGRPDTSDSKRSHQSNRAAKNEDDRAKGTRHDRK